MKLKRITVLCTALTLMGAAIAPAAAASEDGQDSLAKRLREAIVAQNFKDVIDLTPPAAGTARVAAAGQREKYDQSPAELMNRARLRTTAAAAAAAGKPLHQTPNMDA